MTTARTYDLTFASEAETAAFAVKLSVGLRAGDTLLLSGDIGAGKTFFARALIQARLEALDAWEDVPSPTFTVVQVYDLQVCDLWHVDLYRLTSSSEVPALGLEDAFETGICLVEWPDRLGPFRPEAPLELSFQATGETSRTLSLKLPEPWASRLEPLL